MTTPTKPARVVLSPRSHDAVDEYASHPYGVASISKIVERAGIAKGSIYQYFVDKEDFYLYLVEVAIERQMALLAEFTGGVKGDLFTQLRWQMSATLRVGWPMTA